MKNPFFLTRGQTVTALLLIAAFVFAIALSWERSSQAQKLDEGKNDLAPEAGTISGIVFQDFNGDGSFDTSGGTAAAPEAVDVGMPGVLVRAYTSGGLQAGSTATTAPDGTYSISTTGTVGPYRVEFSLPVGSPFSPSARTVDSVSGSGVNNSGSTVQFVNDGTIGDVNLAVNRPQDFCADNPVICSQMYGVGSANLPATVFSIPYNAGSTRTTGGDPVTDFQTPAETNLANSDQVGTTFGLGYRRANRTIYAAAFMKKHAKFGPGGTGAIYAINRNTAAVSTYVNLNTLFGANTAGANPHDTSNYDFDNGQTTWNAVGKVAFGGLALNEVETLMYTMNLANRTLYEIPLTATPTVANIRTSAFPTTMPGCVNASDVRPFAISFYEGLIYVGAVCSADATNTIADADAYIYTVDPTTLVFSAAPVFRTALDYQRTETDPGIAADWGPWTTNYTTLSAGHHIYPQPIVTDIDFDRRNMIISLRDRNGDQTGYNQASDPNNPGDFSRKGITAGEMLRACGNPTSLWTIESNGRCGGLGGAPQNTGEGPGNGEYYYQDNYHPNGTPHDEVSLGSVHQIPGHNEMVATIFDPPYIPNDNIYDAGGFRWFTNSTGAQNRGYLAYRAGEFGKANGMGNVIALCEAAPIEIGNRVWRDMNGNGVQDPGEPVFAGITVRLYQGSTLVGTAVTDANGEYYFVFSTTADGNLGDNIGQVNGGILYNTAYQVRFDNPTNYNPGGPLSGLLLTTVNQTSQNGDDDSSDSDATTVANPPGSPAGNFPVISLTTGGPGANNHTFDVGFTVAPTAASVSVEGRALLPAGNGVRNATVILTETDGTQHVVTTGSFGYYRFDEIEAGQTVVVSIRSKRFTFNPSSRVVTVTDSITDLDFVAEE